MFNVRINKDAATGLTFKKQRRSVFLSGGEKADTFGLRVKASDSAETAQRVLLTARRSLFYSAVRKLRMNKRQCILTRVCRGSISWSPSVLPVSDRLHFWGSPRSIFLCSIANTWRTYLVLKCSAATSSFKCWLIHFALISIGQKHAFAGSLVTASLELMVERMNVWGWMKKTVYLLAVN